jgi:hypothetical protein
MGRRRLMRRWGCRLTCRCCDVGWCDEGLREKAWGLRAGRTSILVYIWELLYLEHASFSNRLKGCEFVEGKGKGRSVSSSSTSCQRATLCILGPHFYIAATKPLIQQTIVQERCKEKCSSFFFGMKQSRARIDQWTQQSLNLRMSRTRHLPLSNMRFLHWWYVEDLGRVHTFDVRSECQHEDRKDLQSTVSERSMVTIQVGVNVSIVFRLVWRSRFIVNGHSIAIG